MAQIVLKNVRKRFGDVETIHGVDLEIKDREFVTFVGPSGCGKSTLLRLIAGLEDISDGEMLFDGERVNALPPAKRGVAMVFQSYALYPHMTVYDNMAFGMKLAKSEAGEMDRKVREAAKILELDPLLDRLPKELSGGQRQRVAIGRAIVRDPRVFLFDEPLSNLDASLRVQMRLEIAKLHERMDATMIYVTHDQVEAMTLADKIVVLRAGNVEQVGAPLELYHYPQNKFVAGFIGSPQMNFIPVTPRGTGDAQASIATPTGGEIAVAMAPGGAVGEAVTLGIRPEHMALTDPDHAPLSGEVVVVEKLGEASFAYVQMPATPLVTVRIPGDTAVSAGERVGLSVEADNCHLFKKDESAIPRIRA